MTGSGLNLKHVSANRNSHQDFIQNYFSILGGKPCGVYIAVAFFTDTDVVEAMTKNGCDIKLIVRLGFPTAPRALKKALRNKNIQVRYITSRYFHPKLYLFGEKGAVVGSANLTKDALARNQEVCVLIDKQDQRFDELMSIFNEYWSQAQPLTDEILKKYEIEFNKLSSIVDRDWLLENAVRDKIGEVGIQNIESDNNKSKKEIFIEDYRKSHQSFEHAFSKLLMIYNSTGKRLVPESIIPIRIEIDQLINFVRIYKAQGEKWHETPLRLGKDQENYILAIIEEWFQTKEASRYLVDQIAPINYPKIKHVFESKNSIETAEKGKLYDALLVCHAFYDHARHNPGGAESFKEIFYEVNKQTQIREILDYLLHGEEEHVLRLARCIFQKEFRINNFGRACVQELFGWVGKENLPICNGRTTKAMRFLGFDIDQVYEMG